MARPGIILVRSAPKPNFTAHGLTRWYNKKHMPEMLATGGVSVAASYQAVSAPDDGQQRMPYLAVYHLNDMDWLHEEGCGFWRLPLVLDDEDGGRSVFEVADFETEFWEVVERTVDDRDETPEGETGDDRGPARHVVLVHLVSGSENEEDAKALLRASMSGLMGARRVRSTVLKKDESHPSSPLARKKKVETPLEQSAIKYLGFHEISSGEVTTVRVAGTVTLQYTLLAASGDAGN